MSALYTGFEHAYNHVCNVLDVQCIRDRRAGKAPAILCLELECSFRRISRAFFDIVSLVELSKAY